MTMIITSSQEIDAVDDDKIELANVNVEETVEETDIKGLGNITKCAPNSLALHHDIMKCSKAEMDKLNLKVVRVNERERKIRYNCMASNIGQCVIVHRDLRDGNNVAMDNGSFMEKSLARHQEAHITGGQDEIKQK